METARPLAEILTLDGVDFGLSFYDLLTQKKNRGERLDSIEEEAWLLLSMLLDIEMEGLIDLFHQLYTLRDCDVVEAGLKKLGLCKMAQLFAEAKAVFTAGRIDMTEDEFRQIDPFGQDRDRKFDELEKEILAEGSEIYLIGERVERYVKQQLRGRP